MKRYVVECDICGREIHEWYEVKTKYVSFDRAGKTTRRNKTVICWDCRDAFIKTIRNRCY